MIHVEICVKDEWRAGGIDKWRDIHYRIGKGFVVVESINRPENRKIFFLHPQAVVQDELVRALIANNFEAYLVRNHVSAKMVLRDFPDSILLIQVDSGLDEEKWIEYADSLKSNPVFSSLTICVLSVTNMPGIRKTYLEPPGSFSYGFSYGGYKFSALYPVIEEMLKSEKANPPGVSIKGTAPDKLKISIAFTRDEKKYEGRLRDISISGFTCKIDGNEPLLPGEIPVQPIIVTYNSTQFTLSGRIAGNHGQDDSIYLILFDGTVVVDKKDDIYNLIHTCMQAQIDSLIMEKSKKDRLRTQVPRSQLYRR